jgi:hypothetical protein
MDGDIHQASRIYQKAIDTMREPLRGRFGVGLDWEGSRGHGFQYGIRDLTGLFDSNNNRRPTKKFQDCAMRAEGQYYDVLCACPLHGFFFSTTGNDARLTTISYSSKISA